jgi:hypothetical protein
MPFLVEIGVLLDVFVGLEGEVPVPNSSLAEDERHD